MRYYYYLVEETADSDQPHILFYSPTFRKWYDDVWYGDPEAARAVGQRMTKFGVKVIKFDPAAARAWVEKGRRGR